MQFSHRFIVGAILSGLLAVLPGAVLAFQNPQEQAAMPSTLAASSPILALAKAGERIVGVGLRGHIVISDDHGQHWKQAQSPVSSDLLAVSFPSAKKGWAVGHGGVVLHTTDGGSTWVRQLDGRQAAGIARRHYEDLLGAGMKVDLVLKHEKNLAADGTQPFLDVYFESETTGFIVGTFNRIYRTQDGGKSWMPWMDRVENPDELHFYAIRGGVNGTWMVGEQGMVWRLDAATQRFVAIHTPYKGTLFGLVIEGPGSLMVFGMRGSLMRTADAGKTWETVSTGSPAGITSGAVLEDGSIVLVNQAGGINLSRDHGKTFAPVKTAQPMSYFGVASIGSRKIGLAGAEGVRLETVQ
jgi:photosystem II stability/assembly factor-like uncharacterized protein